MPPSAKANSVESTSQVEPARDGKLYDRNFFLAAASQTGFVIANTLMAHYGRWVEFLGGELRVVGWIMSLGTILSLFLRPWIGQWINRFGAKQVWISGFGVFAIGALGNLLLTDIGASIYILRSFIALGSAIVFAAGLTYVSQIAPAHRQAEAIGIVGIGGFVGMLIGPLLGDLILGADLRTRGDFTLLFVAAGLGNLATIALVCKLKNPPRQSQKASLGLKDFVRSVYAYWPGTILAVDLAFGVCMAIPFVFLSIFIDKAQLNIDGVSVMGLFFWCYAGPGILLRILGRRLPELAGRRKVLLVGLLCMASGLGSYSLVTADRPWMIMLPALLSGLAHALSFHTMTSLTLATFPGHLKGTGSALALMMLDLGTIAGAPLLAILADNYGFTAMYWAASGLVLAAATAYFISSIPVWQAKYGKNSATPTSKPAAP